jgi:hypothetical protein
MSQPHDLRSVNSRGRGTLTAQEQSCEGRGTTQDLQNYGPNLVAMFLETLDEAGPKHVDLRVGGVAGCTHASLGSPNLVEGKLQEERVSKSGWSVAADQGSNSIAHDP